MGQVLPALSPMAIWQAAQEAGARAREEAENRQEAVFERGEDVGGERVAERLCVEADGALYRLDRYHLRKALVTDCSEAYDAGEEVTLTATPDATSTFAGWSGACTGTAACTVTMDATKAVTATFDQVQSEAPAATERVTLSSAGDEGDSDSYGSSISADGRSVAFTSAASNLVADDTNVYADIFVHDQP